MAVLKGMPSALQIRHPSRCRNPLSTERRPEPAGVRTMFYVLIRDDDGSRFSTADLDQGLIVSGRVEPNRDIFGFLGVREEYAPE